MVSNIYIYIYIFFFREFQLIASAPDKELSSDQDINQFLV